MSPELAINDALDGLGRNPKPLSKPSCARLSPRMDRSYQKDILLGQFVSGVVNPSWGLWNNSRTVRRSPRLPSLRNLVGHVVAVGPKKEVAGVAAQRNVTAMQAMQPLGDRTIDKGVCNPVGVMRGAGAIKRPVALYGVTTPKPASAVCLGNFPPKPSNVGLSQLNHS